MNTLYCLSRLILSDRSLHQFLTLVKTFFSYNFMVVFCARNNLTIEGCKICEYHDLYLLPSQTPYFYFTTKSTLNYILMHEFVLQATVLFFFPLQWFPFLHFLFCFLVPPPHDLLQDVWSFHFPQPKNKQSKTNSFKFFYLTIIQLKKSKKKYLLWKV